MSKCFLCETHITKTSEHAVAQIDKGEHQQKGKATIMVSICLGCIRRPNVIRYKIVRIKPWVANVFYEPYIKEK